MSNSTHSSQSNDRAFIMAQATQPPAASRSLETLPEQAISRDVLLEKYAKDGEQSPGAVRSRVDRALAAIDREGRHAHGEAKFLGVDADGLITPGPIDFA